MLFLEYPKIIISIHTHEPEENAAKSEIELYRPWLPQSDDSNLLIN